MTFMKRLAAAQAEMTQEDRDKEKLESIKGELAARKSSFAKMDEGIKDFFRGEHELRTKHLERQIAKLEA